MVKRTRAAHRLISEGAEAKLYGARLFGIDAVLKHRARKEYRIAELDERLRLQRTRSEARMLYAASSAGANVPAVLFLGNDKIVMERIDGRMMSAITAGGWSMRTMRGSLRRLGAQLAILHNAGIAHGDFTPANILLGGSGKVYVIDFGLAETTGSAEDKAIDIILMKRSIPARAYAEFVRAYRAEYAQSGSVLARVSEIERRGRYQARTLLSA